jgi:hypothetical protein
MFKSALRIVLTTLVVAANAWPADAARFGYPGARHHH